MRMHISIWIVAMIDTKMRVVPNIDLYIIARKPFGVDCAYAFQFLSNDCLQSGFWHDLLRCKSTFFGHVISSKR